MTPFPPAPLAPLAPPASLAPPAPRPTRAPPRAIVLSPEQREVFPPGLALRAAHDRLWPMMRSIAMRLADDDADFADDLTQEAFIHLWHLDPSRFDDDDQPYLKKALWARMLNVLDHEERVGRPDLMLRADVRAW